VLERKPVLFTVLSLVAILIGGIFELVPTFLIKSNVPTIEAVTPYTPLELHGRDIYIREGCVNCHTQMVRPFRSETERYGEYSKAGEFVYDHPFLWGSKRTGPDLHRIGNKYPDSWHYYHMLDPDQVSSGSIMPPYPWLFEDMIDKELTAGKINALRTIGVPYQPRYEEIANEDLDRQAQKIVDNLKAQDGIEVVKEAEIIALIAYLQRLGTDIKATKE
jgi:cytochrome c oxidase cbb3-type subunit I/II